MLKLKKKTEPENKVPTVEGIYYTTQDKQQINKQPNSLKNFVG
jgi:hypothetical protein